MSPLIPKTFLSASQMFLSKSDLSVLYLVFKTNPLVKTSFTFGKICYTKFSWQYHYLSHCLGYLNQ